MYSGVAKGTSQTKAMLNSKKIKMVELHEPKGIRQEFSVSCKLFTASLKDVFFFHINKSIL